MSTIKLKGPGLNDFFAEEMVKTHGAAYARAHSCGEMLEAVERVIAAQQASRPAVAGSPDALVNQCREIAEDLHSTAGTNRTSTALSLAADEIDRQYRVILALQADKNQLILSGAKADQRATEADERAAVWERTAGEYHKGLEYYRGLVTRCGELFGEAAKTADDGTVQMEVLRAKVPELVAGAVAVLRQVVEWNRKYPSQRIFSHSEVLVIAREMDVINDRAKKALGDEK